MGSVYPTRLGQCTFSALLSSLFAIHFPSVTLGPEQGQYENMAGEESWRDSGRQWSQTGTPGCQAQTMMRGILLPAVDLVGSPARNS